MLKDKYVLVFEKIVQPQVVLEETFLHNWKCFLLFWQIKLRIRSIIFLSSVNAARDYKWRKGDFFSFHSALWGTYEIIYGIIFCIVLVLSLSQYKSRINRKTFKAVKSDNKKIYLILNTLKMPNSVIFHRLFIWQVDIPL